VTVAAPSSRSLRATTSLQSICASAPTRTSTMATTPLSGPVTRGRRRCGAEAGTEAAGLEVVVEEEEAGATRPEARGVVRRVMREVRCAAERETDTAATMAGTSAGLPPGLK